jgi:hypothetical protein
MLIVTGLNRVFWVPPVLLLPRVSEGILINVIGNQVFHLGVKQTKRELLFLGKRIGLCPPQPKEWQLLFRFHG